jgi:aspartate-semialdehyde dehydrogenase
MDELFSQTRGVFVNDTATPEQFTKPIAFNCIPHIDKFMDDGFTKEEWKMAVETRKILDPDIQVSATAVRVPAFIGHGEAVNVEFESEITLEQAFDALRGAPGLTVLDRREDGGYATQVDVAGEDPVFVSRLRVDPTVPHGLAFWCVGDNLRKGAALNAVQIAEEMVRQGLLVSESA